MHFRFGATLGNNTSRRRGTRIFYDRGCCSCTGVSEDNSKQGKDTLTMSNLIRTLDDLFTTAKRVELLMFDGMDPGGWLMRSELYFRINQKLSGRSYGLFVVLKRIGPVAYQLALPLLAKVHPLFHVSQLKKEIGNRVDESTLPFGLVGDSTDVIEPEAMLATRTRFHNGTYVAQWSRQWKGRQLTRLL
ncbi:hypothetical protein SESBI_48849 [Sesbania bispinosa]|nr:hypothetical protein SESBI_48849 [Sesbania bispinosa]